LDPFCGSGTTGEAALLENMRAILIDQDPDSISWTKKRLSKPLQTGLF
jgi:DNA modification methylase